MYFFNQMNGYQIFVRTEDLESVSQKIAEYVKSFGCAAYLDIDSERPSPILAKRNQRKFTISTPKYQQICIWEDGGWADKKLAHYLSEILRTESIWLMLSDITNTWAYIRYLRGKQVALETKTSANFLEQAEAFVQQQQLPFAFIYFEDPNLNQDLIAIEAMSLEDESEEGRNWEYLADTAKQSDETHEDELGIPVEVFSEEVDSLSEFKVKLKAEIANFIDLVLSCQPNIR